MVFFLWEWTAIWICFSLFFLEYSPQIFGQMSLDKPNFYITELKSEMSCYISVHTMIITWWTETEWKLRLMAVFLILKNILSFCLQKLRPAFCLGKLVLFPCQWVSKAPLPHLQQHHWPAQGLTPVPGEVCFHPRPNTFCSKSFSFVTSSAHRLICLCECGAMILAVR